MHVILLALGLAGAAAGLGLLAINFPVDMVRLAHTLLIVGAIAITGGAILFSIAASNRQLRRIAQALDARPQPRPADVPPPAETTLEPIPPVLAPTTAASMGPAGVASDPPPASDLNVAPDSPLHPAALDTATASVPSAPPPKTENSFDAMWANAARAAHGDHRTPDPADDSEPHVPPSKTGAAGGESVTVFKSGVIDGMAYTLYTDGSIEAEMPGGTARFATVDDLRAYLDEHT